MMTGPRRGITAVSWLLSTNTNQWGVWYCVVCLYQSKSADETMTVAF